jgi:parallel beta-helix repeat protein
MKALQRYIFWLCGIALLTLSACGQATTASETTPAPTAPPPTATPAAAVSALTQRTSPCAVLEQPGAIDSSVVQAPPEGAPATVNVTYDGDSNTIVLREGSVTTLGGVGRALNRPELLRELASGEWLLTANLEIRKDAALTIAAPETRWLKLHSDDASYAAIRAVGGQLAFDKICVSSWDVERNDYDQNYEDGRSYVLARDGSRMVIHGSELRYLGYNQDESFGVSWRTPGTGGEIVDSYLAHNFFGLYTYEVSDLIIRGNEVHHNVLYGLNPHTRSLRLVIEDNVVHNNGKHGIILADACSNGVVRNNVVYNNLHHGIVLYQHSDTNVVEGNLVYGNGAQGINVNQSFTNTLRANIVYENLEAGIGVGQGSGANQLIENDIHANLKDGIVLYSDAKDTTVQKNIVRDNERYGIHVKSAGAVEIDSNQVSGNKIGAYLNVEPAPKVAWETNRIEGNRDAEVRTGDE